jgi:hypothetical protein
MIDKPMQAMQTLMITSVTRHQQYFSMRNTNVNVLSAKTHQRVSTGNTRARRPEASICRPCSSHVP